jgi:predicted nucleotidyltransferase
MLWLAERLARIPGVVAVSLGGSRAHGMERPDSDWDFGLYYSGTIDPEHVRALGYPGIVAAPGEWAYPMNGGAWLTVDGRKVDVLYRDLDDVNHWIAESERGDWELYRVPGYLAGMPSYALVGELALARVLTGSLPRPGFPERLRERAPERWRWEAEFALGLAEVHAKRGDVAGCLGKAALGIVAEAHARLAGRGEWVLNEKEIVRRAGLESAEAVLARHATPENMAHVVAQASHAAGLRPMSF